MSGLWAGYIMRGPQFAVTGANGIWSDDYSSLIRKGLVERIVAEAPDNEDEIVRLKNEALALLHTGPLRAVIETLEEAERLEHETPQEQYRLTATGIAHMKAQPDAIPACATA
jgi:hypothetical protein